MNDGEKADKATFSLYERLFMRAYTVTLTRTGEEERITQKITVADQDVADAYRLLLLMRSALIQCENQFRYYGQGHEGALNSQHLSLVEKRDLETKRDRDLGIAGILHNLVADTPQVPADDWLSINTAPQDGRLIRVLGKRKDGQPYVETTRWANVCWSVENIPQYGPCTHWQPLEQLPEGYA